jgi:carbonic anhydrase
MRNSVRNAQSFCIALGLLLVAAVPAGPQPQWKTPWSYEGPKGPEHWGDLDPDYAACKTGREQSPIDIRDMLKASLPALRFEYKPGPLYILNNGYTAVRVNYPEGNGNFLVFGDRRYELTQFHFHHPSEEYIKGKPFDMEIHLMHQSDDGRVAGVAILLKAGDANAAVEKLWQFMPQTVSAERLIPNVQIDPSGLLPHDTTAYYKYMGSQTAPPCTEGVAWFVLKTPVTVSAEQISAFAKLYPHDVRPLQPLNGRIVSDSQ